MKKIFLVLFVNLIVLVLLMFLTSIYIEKNILRGRIDYKLKKIFYTQEKKDFYNNDIQDFQYEKNIVKKIDFNKETYNSFCGETRYDFGKQYSKNSIIMMGCSYAYGHGVKREKTFPYMLSEITQRPVYNYSNCGGDFLQSFFYFEQKKKEIEKIDYFIYVYMYDHINRYLTLQSLYRYYNFIFEQPKNKFHQEMINKSVLYKFICCVYQLKKILRGYPDTEELEQYLKQIILKVYKKLKSNVSNAKFIIILYDEKYPDTMPLSNVVYVHKFINSKIWRELEEETNGNIKVVRTRDVMGFYFDKNYKLEEDIAAWHPNARVWKEFTPKFVSQYIK